MVKKQKPPSTPKKPRKPIVEDGYLWEYVAKEVTPLEKREQLSSSSHTEQPPSHHVKSDIIQSVDSHLRASPPATILKPSYELSAGDAREVNRAMAKQIKSGKYPVDMQLDLHGKTQEQAHLALMQAVERAFHSGKRCLLVITGKGKFTQGGGILRRQLPAWLNQENLRPYILMINEAAPSDGGSGAFYVMIRKKRG